MTNILPLSPFETYQRLAKNLNTIIRGKEQPIRHLLAGYAAGGHILLEDYPGTGKTSLAKALALSVNIDFKRIQFTPDLLPSDVIGLSIYDQKDHLFRLHKGPVFTHILLVDEINRTSPRTQSALLEAMAEKQVSIDGVLHKLDELFFVIATQNPAESHGTYPLPEAQMDRFAMQLSLGYITAEEEMQLLIDQEKTTPLDSLQPCASLADIIHLREQVCQVHISDELRRYIVQLVQATRSIKGVLLGASPRASLMLMQVAKALALYENRTFVIPEDVQDAANPVIAHRLILEQQARFSGLTREQIIDEILAQIPVPA